MYLYDTNNMARATAGAELTTRTVVVEIKYFCTKNVVIHTENCKLNLPLDCSTTQMEKNRVSQQWERLDSFSASDSDSDSEEEVDSALETMNMIRPTRLGRVRTLTSRMADFLQAGMVGMWSRRD